VDGVSFSAAKELVVGCTEIDYRTRNISVKRYSGSMWSSKFCGLQKLDGLAQGSVSG
jgi:hypothetical protein